MSVHGKTETLINPRAQTTCHSWQQKLVGCCLSVQQEQGTEVTFTGEHSYKRMKSRNKEALSDYAISRKGIKLMHKCTYQKESRNHADCTQLQFDNNY